jgi:hypothetical protein
MKSALLLLLVSCAPPPIAIADASVAPASALLEDDASRAVGAVELAPGGVLVMTDAEWIGEYNRRNATCASGVTQGNVIVLASTEKWSTCIDANGQADQLRLTARGAKLTLAHELGHAAGWVEHTATGLMALYDTSCIGREVECLRGVLTELGTRRLR